MIRTAPVASPYAAQKQISSLYVSVPLSFRFACSECNRKHRINGKIARLRPATFKAFGEANWGQRSRLTCHHHGHPQSTRTVRSILKNSGSKIYQEGNSAGGDWAFSSSRSPRKVVPKPVKKITSRHKRVLVRKRLQRSAGVSSAANDKVEEDYSDTTRRREEHKGNKGAAESSYQRPQPADPTGIIRGGHFSTLSTPGYP